MVRTQASDMYIEITVLTLANIQHSHGICPITQLSWLSLEWTDVYTSSGGRKIDVMYIIDVYMYSLYQHSYHTPLNDDVCGMFMEFSVIYIIKKYIYSLYHLSHRTPLKMTSTIIKEANDMSCTEQHDIYVNYQISSSHPSSLMLMCMMCLYK
jgi:hypothetical protein